MQTSRVTYIPCLIILLFHSALHAQEPQRPATVLPEPTDSLSLRNSAAIFFERNLNTFNWIGRALIDTSIAGTSYGLNEQYITNIIQIDGTSTTPRTKLQSIQHNTLFRLSQPVLPDLSGKIEWSSLKYADDKAVGLSTASSYDVLGGLEYNATPFLALSPLAGYRWERQLQMSDQGLSYTLAARMPGVVADGYQLSGAAQFHQDRVNPRLLEGHFARMRAEKYFAGNTRDSLLVSFAKNRREFYSFAVTPAPGSNNTIESRIENVFSLANLLDYEIDRNFSSSIFVTLTNRTLDRDLHSFGAVSDSTVQFDTQINEFRLDTYLQALYRSDDGRKTASARFSYSERDEAHRAKPISASSPNIEILFNTRNKQEQTKDNLARRTSIAGTLGLPVSLSDSVSFSGTASILRYDTPSDENLDDRDELLTAVSVATAHHISQYLDLFISIDGILGHVVYLLKERSANNNYNRILRLSPRIAYYPLRAVVSVNTFEVLANYTVYDYEQQVAMVRSFSYRQFGWIDSTSIDFTPKLGLDFYMYVKLYERGQLSWSDFKERPENSFVDKTYALQARFTPSLGSQFAVGIRYFSQTRYAYEESGRRLDLFLRSVGPTCTLAWEVNRFSRLGLTGWYEQRQQADGTTRSLANMKLNILINF